jgi:hypothetical protein
MAPDLLDALRRRRAGDYVRDSNVPSLRQQREDHVRRAADFNMARRDGEYADLFAALGLDAETSAQLRNHLRQLYEAKVDASRALGEVLQVKMDYDDRLKKLVGENYAVYRATEAAYPARLEYESFHKFAAGQGLTLVPGEHAQIEKLIQNAQAYSSQTESDWGSPYKAVPPPVGGEDLRPFLMSKLELLQARSARLLTDARAAGLSYPTLQSLEAHYRAEIAAQQMQLARVENPDLNRQMMLKRQLESVKARPNPNPRLIERLEGQLKAFQQAGGP